MTRSEVVPPPGEELTSAEKLARSRHKLADLVELRDWARANNRSAEAKKRRKEADEALGPDDLVKVESAARALRDVDPKVISDPRWAPRARTALAEISARHRAITEEMG